MKNLTSLSTALRPLAAALGLAGLAAVSLSACDSANSKPQEGPPQGPPPISAAAVIERHISETQDFSGRLEAIERVDIRARVGGFITAVNFKPGSEVKKGDVLFVIDPRPFEAEFNRAEAAAMAGRAKTELAKLELARAEKLVADKAIPQRELDEKASAVKELSAYGRAALAQLETARLNLGFTQVRAPIDGRVGKAEITVGNLVDNAAVLTSVVSTKRIYASFDGDEATYLRVGAAAQKGMPVTVRVGLANEAGFPHEGQLEFVDNQLDPKTGSVRMRAAFANSDNLLVPGLFARVQLGGGTARTKALLIDERAIGTDQSHKFVVVVGADNKAEFRPVTLGPSVDGLRVVRTGLKVGEKIVVNGLQRVRPGAPVSPQMVPMVADAGLANKLAAAPASTVKE